MELAPGAFVRDGIRLVRELASGNMGSVWEAEHARLKTRVAVKFVHSKLIAEAPEVLERFEREAAAAAQIKSPHVVQVFDSGITADGVPYIVMELLEGESLREKLDREGVLTKSEAIELVQQVAQALDKAHKKGIIHRDVTPQNIFLGSDEGKIHAKLVDFGVAKLTLWTRADAAGLTNANTLIGTPAYISRDQVIGQRPHDALLDLWSLAVCAYEMLTGALPFDGATLALVCVAICEAHFTPPSGLRPQLDDRVDAFFARALHTDPSERFQSGKALAEALGAALSTTEDGGKHATIDTAPPTSSVAHTDLPALRPRPWVGLSIAGVGLATGMALFVHFGADDHPQPAAAPVRSDAMDEDVSAFPPPPPAKASADPRADDTKEPSDRLAPSRASSKRAARSAAPSALPDDPYDVPESPDAEPDLPADPYEPRSDEDLYEGPTQGNDNVYEDPPPPPPPPGGDVYEP